MALSDTCYESLAELGDGVNRYFDWGYDNAHISGVIDAMFALANVGVRLDMLEFVSNENIELIVGRAVVLALLHETDITDVIEHKAALIALANVATVNVLFARALVLIEDWLSTKEGQHYLATEYPQFALAREIVLTARDFSAGLAI